MDPITGHSMGHALRDAELLIEALVCGLGGGARLDKALARYARAPAAGTPQRRSAPQRRIAAASTAQ